MAPSVPDANRARQTNYVSTVTRTNICKLSCRSTTVRGAANAPEVTRPGTAKVKILPSVQFALGDAEAQTGSAYATLNIKGTVFSNAEEGSFRSATGIAERAH